MHDPAGSLRTVVFSEQTTKDGAFMEPWLQLAATGGKWESHQTAKSTENHGKEGSGSVRKGFAVPAFNSLFANGRRLGVPTSTERPGSPRLPARLESLALSGFAPSVRRPPSVHGPFDRERIGSERVFAAVARGVRSDDRSSRCWSHETGDREHRDAARRAKVA
jgi:hypothetical protein